MVTVDTFDGSICMLPWPMMEPRNVMEPVWNSHFLGLDEHIVLKEALDDGLDLVAMFLSGTGEDEDVIQVDQNVLIYHVSSHIINQRLEHSGGCEDGCGGRWTQTQRSNRK